MLQKLPKNSEQSQEKFSPLMAVATALYLPLHPDSQRRIPIHIARWIISLLLTAITQNAAGCLVIAHVPSQNIGRCFENFMQLAPAWLLASHAQTIGACLALDECSLGGGILWML
jgi:hypothetical protein